MQVTCSIGRETLLEIGVPEENILLLPMGIDLNRFQHTVTPTERTQIRDNFGVPPKALVIGCFQKDGEGWEDGMKPKLIKGPDILADVLESLSQDHPVFVVIPGPARGYLKQRLNKAKIPYAAPGLIPDRELRKLYNTLDIYISPSRDEGGPAGALESMASGVPLVSTRTGMPVDMIENGKNGFLVDVEDVDGLVNCTTELINNPSFRQRLADNALETIQKYNWPILSKRYVSELYDPMANSYS
jgi:glycosyltransferase involved in cell wall biosynthesis